MRAGCSPSCALHPVRDVYVVRARNTRLVALGLPGAPEARASIAEARRLAADGKHQEAAVAFGAVAKIGAATVSPPLRDAAEFARVGEERLAAADSATLLERAWASVRDVVGRSQDGRRWSRRWRC
jgi:hypothetical protein